MTIKEIRDGIPWEEWPDIQVDRSTFAESGLIYENGEWGIPLALLGNPPLVSLRYSVGVEQWDADSIESYKLKTSLAEPGEFYADGDLTGWVTLSRFRDGTPFEEWEQLPVPSDFDWGLFPQGIEWKIPWDLFSGSERLAVMYITSGYDRSGEIVWQSDSTDWMELDLRGTGR